MKSFFIIFLIALPLLSQTKDSLFLRIVLPEKDTLKYSASRHRIAASTNHSSKAFINYKEVRVYPSGAFVGMHVLGSDTSTLHIAVMNADGDSLTKDFVFLKPVPKLYPDGEIYIDNVSSPSEDMWLTAGDILEVRMRGTPGQQPVFDIDGVESGIPMRELTSKNGNGLGSYVGQFKVTAADQCIDAAVQVRIKKSFFSSEESTAKGKVSFIQDSLPRVVEITGKRPFLNAGLGSDRLGGAKLGFLVEGVRAIVTGKVGSQFRVKLGEGMEAWLPQEYALLQPVNTLLPSILTGSVSINGDDSEDVIRIGIGQKVPYTSEQLTDPMAIVVNLFGATSNTNWITHHLSAAGIKQVKSTQVGDEHFQLTILLNHQQHWGYDIAYEGSTLRIRVRRPPVVVDTMKPLSKMTIAIDAGHGIGSEGAKGATGVVEKDMTLALAKELNAQLKALGISTVMTRETDENVTMTDRADKIINAGVHLLVSIHCNSIGESSDPEQVKGTSAYYRYPGFKTLSDIMYKQMLSLGLAEWGVTGNFNFSLSGPTQFPNVLVETAFLSNPDDEMKLLDENFRTQVAAKIIGGLEEFVKLYAR
ncbi:MAG: N-acetylmuramoyl-L-alanine amidase [Bacteriovoracaceae bacterium]